MSAPPLLLQRAVAQALALAATAAGGEDDPDDDYAPLVGTKIYLGRTMPTQSPDPGAAALPPAVAIYGWEGDSQDKDGGMTAPQFATTDTIVVECRAETKDSEASATLPGVPTSDQVNSAISGALGLFTYAVKKAIATYLQAAARALNGGQAFVERIEHIAIGNKFDERGQRVAGSGGVTVKIVYTETFEPPIDNDLDLLDILIDATAGGIANQGNTGNGTIGAVTVGAGAQAGAYAVLCTSATAFNVTAPDSTPVGSGTVGTAFAKGGLSFTIAAGTVPFTAGDGFTVTVQAIHSQVTV